MSAFDEVTLIWKGEEFKIAPNKVMEAIARVEQYVTLEEIHRATNGQGIKRVAIARAFSSLLKFAGATNVTEEDIYKGMFQSEGGNTVMASVIALMSLMVPTSVISELENSGEASSGNSNRRARRVAASSSRRRTKRQSADGTSHPLNSGSSTPSNSGG